jgi:hypothetical protein
MSHFILSYLNSSELHARRRTKLILESQTNPSVGSLVATRVITLQQVTVQKWHTEEMHLRAFTIGFLAFGSIIFSAGPAIASSTVQQTSGNIDIWLTSGDSAVAKVLMTGVIGDYGSARMTNQSGKPDADGNYELLKMTRGSILLDIEPSIVAYQQHGIPNTYSPINCSVFINTLTFNPIVKGTGLYAGIQGQIQLNERFGTIFDKDRQGQCESHGKKRIRSASTIIFGNGAVAF